MNALQRDNLRQIKAAAEGTAAPAPAGRKKLSRAEAARHASLVRWGKEQPFAARLQAVRDRRKAAKIKKAKGGKGKKPQAAPVDKQAEADKQRQANLQALGQSLDNADNEAMSSRGLAALDAARRGEEPPKAMADGLIKRGFAERGADGRFRLTTEGRALMRAADKGDEQGALDAISRASDRAARNTEKQAREAEREQKKAEREKKGGGGSKKPKEKAAPKEADTSEEDAPATDEETASATAAEVGLDEESVSALREAADGAGADSPELQELGLTDSEGDATPEGVDALEALERGDAGGYRRAIRRAKARKRREEGQAQREGEREKARKEKEEGSLRERAERTKRGEIQKKERDDRAALRKREQEYRSKQATDRRVSAEVDRIAAARARKALPEIKQSAEDRAMFANMGAAGTLRSKGPSGKRTGPAMGKDKGDDPANAPTGHASRSQPYSPEALEAHARTDAQSFLGFEHENGMRVVINTNTNAKGTKVKGTHRVTVHQPNGSYTEFQQNNKGIRTFGQQMKDRGMIYVSPQSLSGTKGLDAMHDLIIDLEALRDEALELADDAALDSVKAGRRNSGADQATIDRGYRYAEELCAIFEELGATVEEEEYEEEEAPAIRPEVAAKMEEDLEAHADVWGRLAAIDGDSVKALDGDRVGALAVRFGSSDEPDMSLMRDYFTKSTDFWLDAWDRRPMLYHHAMDEDTSDAPRIGTWTKAEVKDEGVWLEGQLDRSHRYYTAIKELIKRGALRLSSDSAPHLVRRAVKGNTHEVTRWPLLAASLTPTPAEPRLTAVSFKAFIAELGIDDIPSTQEAREQEESERADALKAVSDRTRRALMELDLLTLELTT